MAWEEIGCALSVQLRNLSALNGLVNRYSGDRVYGFKPGLVMDWMNARLDNSVVPFTKRQMFDFERARMYLAMQRMSEAEFFKMFKETKAAHNAFRQHCIELGITVDFPEV